MSYEIVLAPQAVEDLRGLPEALRRVVTEALEQYLQVHPTRENRSHIKRLRIAEQPHFRLRTDEARIFYDVRDSVVEVLAIVPGQDWEQWLQHVAPGEEARS